MDSSSKKHQGKESARASKRSKREFQLALKYDEAILATIREPLVVMDASLRIISANESFYDSFLVKPEETEGKLIYDLGNRQWDIPKLRELLEEVLPKNTRFNDFEVNYEFPQLGKRIMLLNASRLYDKGQKTQMILLAIEDITERKRLEYEMVSSEVRYRRLFETAQDGILILDAETGLITDVNPFLIEMLGYYKNEFIGKKLWEISPFKDTKSGQTAFLELQTKGYIRYSDLPLETKDGRSMEVEFVSNVYQVNGQKVIQCNIRDNTARVKAEHDIRERVKELQCLYSISRVLEKPELSLDEILQEIVNLIPPSMQYPEITCARILLRDKTFATSNCMPAEGILSSDIKVRGTKAGAVEICYLELMPDIYEGPFLKEERLLIDDIADRLGIIIERMQTEKALKRALEESQIRSQEISAVLDGAKAVLAYREFKEAARAIFDFCKELIGATGGYVALLNKEGSGNEVLFLEAGERPCDVDPNLPMPIRGLRSKAYQNCKAVYDNDFSRSDWAIYMPHGHVALDNVLFAPLILQGKPLGLIGLANKAGGFTERDAGIASAFADLAAIALQNSRTLDSLQIERDKLTGILDAMEDGVYIIARNGDIEYANPALKRELGPIEGRKCHSYLHDREEVCPWCNSKEVFAGKIMRWEMYLPKTNKTYDFIDTPLNNYDGTISKLEIFHDITKRKKFEQMKDEFIGMVSHELKTPLTVIIGALNVALIEGITPDERKGLMNDAAVHAEELADMVDNLLELSRHQSNHLSLQIQQTQIEPVVQAVVDRLRNRSAIHHLATDIPPELPPVSIDHIRIERVLNNLVENAIKYSPKGGKVRIFSYHSGDLLVIGVSDEGIGISPEDQIRLFEPFQRLDIQDKYNISGVGLGLRVCRILVETHGGRIWVESEPGKGSTFFFSLPTVDRKQG